MGKSLNPRKPGVSTGGRPPQEGERYPSGKLKRPGPNQLMVERRKAMCEDVTMASCPFDLAFAKGWISAGEYSAGRAYIAVHARANLGSPGIPSQSDHSMPEPVGDIRAVSWSALSDDEITRIWDSALRDSGPSGTRDEQTALAQRQWKAACAAMTLAEQTEVDNVCVRESWPQWVIQRSAGHMDTSWEKSRTVLISGLRAIRQALAKPTEAKADTFIPAGPANDGPARVFERTVYVQEDGEPGLIVERITRRSAA